MSFLQGCLLWKRHFNGTEVIVSYNVHAKGSFNYFLFKLLALVSNCTGR